MKKYLFALTLFVTTALFSSQAFAQEAPGDWNDGAEWTNPEGAAIDAGAISHPAQPKAYQFTRNNGDGTCGEKAQIRIYFAEKPSIAPHLSQIWYQDAPLFEDFRALNADMKEFETKGYASFCLSVSNIPPAIKLTIDLRPSPTQDSYSLTGTN